MVYRKDDTSDFVLRTFDGRPIKGKAPDKPASIASRVLAMDGRRPPSIVAPSMMVMTVTLTGRG